MEITDYPTQLGRRHVIITLVYKGADLPLDGIETHEAIVKFREIVELLFRHRLSKKRLDRQLDKLLENVKKHVQESSEAAWLEEISVEVTHPS